ncbi:MAG: DUF6159 family protein [Planctomycetota bacterium]
MFDKLGRGWSLVGQSFRVLKLDKELLLFPLISGVSCLLVLGSFALPLANTSYWELMTEQRQIPNDPVAYLLLFAFYFVNYLVIIYFNSALVACAIIRFKGGDPTLKDGLRAATSCLPQIVAWSLVSATVGLILRIIESSSEKAGRIAAALLGMGWSAATYFAVPILVVERVGPVEAVKRSLGLLKKTWGEALSANLGLGLIFFVVFLVALIPLILAGSLVGAGVASGSMALIVLGVAGIVLIVVGMSLVSSALHAILLAAVYIYAKEGVVPDQFDQGLLRGAFEEKPD